MQYLKEENKKNICAAALSEFTDKGFQKASMRTIAKKSGVATGNLYRYYTNKEEMFSEIVEPAYLALMRIIGRDVCTKTINYSIFEEAVENLMPIIRDYREQLLLLVDHSAGTKYENTKEVFIREMEKQLTKYLQPQIQQHGGLIRDNYFFYVVSAAFFEGLFIIIRKYEEEEKVRYLVYLLLSVSFFDIDKRLVNILKND